MKILLVEDEFHIADPIKHVLKKNNYITDWINNGFDAIDLIYSNIYDLIILDIMIPKVNGLEVLSEIRDNNINTPVLILSAKSEIDDKVNGLDIGADDYLTKPFEMDELLARVRAILRRKEKLISNLEYGDISYNPSTLKLVCESKSFDLTLKEAQLFEMLLENKELIVSKDSIIEKLWELDSDANYNYVEVYVSFLRKKLDNLDAFVKIETKRGVGYKLTLGGRDV